MKVIKAASLGCCFGVQCAIDKAINALNTHKDKKVYSLGSLLHNDWTLEMLKKKGLIVVEECDIDKIENKSVVLLRAHGAPPLVEKLLEKKGCLLLDATCPRVKKAQKLAESYSGEGYNLLILGDKTHSEVKGIVGYCKRPPLIIGGESELEEFIKKEDLTKRYALITQTTYNIEAFNKISSRLKLTLPSIKILPTICPATKDRQEALISLQGMVEGIVVIGSKNSANTKRLYSIAKKIFKSVFLVDGAASLPPSVYKLKSVGLTAGASTPKVVIDMVEEVLLKG